VQVGVEQQEETDEDSQINTQLPPHQIIEERVFYFPIEYTGSHILGEGAHGVVVAATKSSGDKQIAIKIIKLNTEPSLDEKKNLYKGPSLDEKKNLYLWKSCYRELSLLIQLKENGAHPNVIALMDALLISISKTEYELMFITKFMKTSLENLMKSTSLTNREKKWYIYQILCGLAYLHSKNISE
jgi:serine/threonine protein kinase